MALKRFPGFIDIHVHLRDPGATHKEDFATGSLAAIKGGFTYILDMPNNPTSTLSVERLNEKIALAKKKAVCDVGFHYGTNGYNTKTFAAVCKNPFVFGLKIYCNHTTGDLLIEDLKLFEYIFAAWKSEKPILVHAEGTQLAGMIALAQFYKRYLHVCHISQTSEVELVRRAKQKKWHVTAGVTPHHLFLTSEDIRKLGPFGCVKPPMDPDKHQESLWEALQNGTIDIVESDHAPHTKEEKESSSPPSGVPGLETTLGLFLRAVHDNKLAEDDVIRLLYTSPRKIFSISAQPTTYVELDPQKSYIVGKNRYRSKCGWSPFDGWKAYGEVETVVLRGKILVQDGRLI